MKAGRIHNYGEEVVMEDLPTPEPGPDEVLIRVHAASLNPLDMKLQSGAVKNFFPLAFPYTVGTDLAGTIERAGPGAWPWSQGDRVLARPDPTRGGAVAEYAVVPTATVADLPAGVSFAVAAGLPTAAGTAQQALFEAAKLQLGQTVLVHAGAGGVGSFAIQLARLAGARVIATASDSGIEMARRLGADRVIDHRSEAFDALLTDLDVVIDTVGGDTQQRSFGVLRRGGVLVSTISPPDEGLAAAQGVEASFVFHQTDACRLEALLGLVEAGKLRVLMDRSVSWGGLDDAWRHQASGHARGKIIITLVSEAAVAMSPSPA